MAEEREFIDVIMPFLDFGILGAIAIFAIRFAVTKLPNLPEKTDLTHTENVIVSKFEEMSKSIQNILEEEMADWEKIRNDLPQHLESHKKLVMDLAKLTEEVHDLARNTGSESTNIERIQKDIATLQVSINELIRTTDRLLYTFQYTLDPKQILDKFRK